VKVKVKLPPNFYTLFYDWIQQQGVLAGREQVKSWIFSLDIWLQEKFLPHVWPWLICKKYIIKLIIQSLSMQ
jgi:hypothetical protein